MSVISDLNAAFKRELGTIEIPKGSNNIIYNTEYYGYPVSGDSYPWCCSFIWVIFKRLGLSYLFCGGQKTAYCPFVVNYAKAHGQWVTNGYRQGDILLFDWDHDGRADHIGWCVGCSGATVMSIEGNASDAVSQRNYPINKIMGAYRPDYPQEAPKSTNSNTQNTSTHNPVDRYMVQIGDNLWSIGEQLGINYLDIAKMNNIQPPYVIYPGQVLHLSKTATVEEVKEEIKESKEKADTQLNIYEVKKGDSLWAIAERELGNGFYYTKIQEANDLKSIVIYPGQKLIIP